MNPPSWHKSWDKSKGKARWVPDKGWVAEDELSPEDLAAIARHRRELEAAVAPSHEAYAHSTRFRKVSNRYPLRVTEAYRGDWRAAMAASDEEVASQVEAWEREQGIEPHDWPRIGRDEGSR